MSRDPLEGYRPSDMNAPSFVQRPSGSFAPPVSPRAVRAVSASPVRRTNIKVVAAILGGSFAVAAGIMAFLITADRSTGPTKGAPDAVASSAAATDSTAVKQGPPPAVPSPTPMATTTP